MKIITRVEPKLIGPFQQQGMTKATFLFDDRVFEVPVAGSDGVHDVWVVEIGSNGPRVVSLSEPSITKHGARFALPQESWTEENREEFLTEELRRMGAPDDAYIERIHYLNTVEYRITYWEVTL